MSCLEKLDRDELLALIAQSDARISEEAVLQARYAVASDRCVAATAKWAAFLKASEEALRAQNWDAYEKERDVRRKARTVWERACRREDRAFEALDVYRSRGAGK